MTTEPQITPCGRAAKLIADPMNGQRWQWRYFDQPMKLWFDYGSAFPATAEGRQQAIEWMKAGGCEQRK